MYTMCHLDFGVSNFMKNFIGLNSVNMVLIGSDFLFGLILYIPANNFSVMLGQICLGLTCTS